MKISEISPEQEADKQTMMEIKKLLQIAKKAYEKAQEAEAAVYIALEDMCLDLDAPTKAENADNLGEAVSCYLCYDEYSLKGLMAEILTQYTQKHE